MKARNIVCVLVSPPPPPKKKEKKKNKNTTLSFTKSAFKSANCLSPLPYILGNPSYILVFREPLPPKNRFFSEPT